MNDLVFLLAVYGCVLLFQQQYQPLLTGAKGTAPLLRILERLPIDWNQKPWTCRLCLSFWVGATMRLAWLTWDWPGVIEPVLYGFAATAVAYLLDEAVRYFRLEI